MSNRTKQRRSGGLTLLLYQRTLHPELFRILASEQVSRRAYEADIWLVEGGHVIAGSPETVRHRLEDLATSLHVGNIFCLMHVGDMPADKCMYSTKLFAEKVMPKLRNVFPDYADDDRFWCKPIAKQVTPGNLPATRDLAALNSVH